MSVRLALLAALLALVPAAAVAAEPRASLPDVEDEVMCVQCKTPLNVSEAPSAEGQRDFIRRRIAEGMTKEQIKDALVVEYGPAVLALPDDDGFDLAAWIVPPLLALLALAAVLMTARRWRRAGAIERAPQREAAELDPEDARRLERDLATYDV